MSRNSFKHHTSSVKERAFDEIAEILFPDGDLGHEWDQGTIEQVGDIVRKTLKKAKK